MRRAIEQMPIGAIEAEADPLAELMEAVQTDPYATITPAEARRMREPGEGVPDE